MTTTHAAPYSEVHDQLLAAFARLDITTAPKHRAECVECPSCRGTGEHCANPDNSDPQDLDLLPCALCCGSGEVTLREVAEYDAWVAEVTESEPVPYTLAIDRRPFPNRNPS